MCAKWTFILVSSQSAITGLLWLHKYFASRKKSDDAIVEDDEEPARVSTVTFEDSGEAVLRKLPPGTEPVAVV